MALQRASVAIGCAIAVLVCMSCREEAATPPGPEAVAVVMYNQVDSLPPVPDTAAETGLPEPSAAAAPESPVEPPAFAESFEALHRVRASTFDTLHSWPDRAPAGHLLPHADAVNDTNGEPWRLIDRGFTMLGGIERGLLYVHVSDEDPFYFVFGSLRQREPDAFERESAASLSTSGDDVVIRRANGEVRMIGALRCAPVCRRCHDCADGALLGAFSYTFREMADD